MSKKWVFLDTNIYMHCLPIPDIDWVDLLELQDEDTMEIIVTRVNLRELDKQKDTNQNRRVTNRIRKFLEDFEKRFDSQDWRVADKVALQYYRKIPEFDLAEKGLDPSSNDDRLVATILEFRGENPDDEVMLFSRDTNIRLTAKGLGIPASEMPQEFIAVEEPDPIEAENKQLKKDLQQLQNARPKLSVSLTANRVSVPVLRTHILPPLSQGSIEAAWAVEAAKYNPLPTQDDFGIVALPNFDNQVHNRHWKLYLQDYRTYLEEKLQFKNFIRQAILLEIQITNSGTVPATDVDVFLTFQPGIEVVGEDQLPEAPDRPEAPAEGSSIYMSSRFKVTPLFHQFQQAQRAEDEPTIVDNKVQFHLRRIRHGTPVNSPKLWVKFRNFDDATSFNFDYRLEVGNLPAPQSGSLNVVLEKKA